MNKKGFTFIELLSVIILLSLILVLVVPNALKAGDNVKKASYKTKIQNIESAAQMYATDKDEIDWDNGCIEIKEIDDELIPYEVTVNFASEVSNSCYKYFRLNVSDLANEKYIKYDEDNYVTDPMDNTQKLNDDFVYVYQKTQRMYAIFQENPDGSKLKN